MSLAIAESGFSLRGIPFFREYYLRNNKKEGQKHIRCFPTCLEVGHNQRGFCGRPIITDLVSKTCYLPEQLFPILYFRFSPSENEEVQVPIITFKEYKENVRTSQYPIRPWMEGAVKYSRHNGDQHEYCFYFNEKGHGWHYGWRSNRFSKDTLHRAHIIIYALEDKQYADSPRDHDQLIPIANTFSPEFSIHSGRRVKSILNLSEPFMKEKSQRPTKSKPKNKRSKYNLIENQGYDTNKRQKLNETNAINLGLDQVYNPNQFTLSPYFSTTSANLQSVPPLNFNNLLYREEQNSESNNNESINQMSNFRNIFYPKSNNGNIIGDDGKDDKNIEENDNISLITPRLNLAKYSRGELETLLNLTYFKDNQNSPRFTTDLAHENQGSSKNIQLNSNDRSIFSPRVDMPRPDQHNPLYSAITDQQNDEILKFLLYINSQNTTGNETIRNNSGPPSSLNLESQTERTSNDNEDKIDQSSINKQALDMKQRLNSYMLELLTERLYSPRYPNVNNSETQRQQVNHSNTPRLQYPNQNLGIITARPKTSDDGSNDIKQNSNSDVGVIQKDEKRIDGSDDDSDSLVNFDQRRTNISLIKNDKQGKRRDIPRLQLDHMD